MFTERGKRREIEGMTTRLRPLRLPAGMILNSPASQKEIARQLADGIDEYFRK